MTTRDAYEAAVDAIFDREVQCAEADYEPSGFIDWLNALRDEVKAIPHQKGEL